MPVARAEQIEAESPVVVLKLVPSLFQHGTLGIMRSLGRIGVPVYAFHNDQWAPAALSRYARGTLVWDRDATLLSADELVAALLELAQRINHPRPILIPVDDIGSMLVSDGAACLKSHFLFPDQPTGLARALSSKKELYLLCKDLGVPTPETKFPQSRRDLLRLMSDESFPIVLKSIDPRLMRQRPGGAAKSVAIAHDQA
ncbi:MAG: hypothetical protein LC797_04120, partial [Chloroflexi bacterium]|nr:hypothetical protein [Chloroflexota bacterium]